MTSGVFHKQPLKPCNSAARQVGNRVRISVSPYEVSPGNGGKDSGFYGVQYPCTADQQQMQTLDNRCLPGGYPVIRIYPVSECRHIYIV